MTAPSTSLDYARWAREQAPALQLTRFGQAQVLTQLTVLCGECHANFHGEQASSR